MGKFAKLTGGLATAIRPVKLIMPAFDANALAVHKRIGHLAARAVNNALQGAAGNLHLFGGLILIKPFQIAQAVVGAVVGWLLCWKCKIAELYEKRFGIMS